MKRLIAMLGMLVLATGATVYAQQPATPADPHHPQGQAQAPAPPAGQQTPKPGAHMGGMMPMMQMCREMMGGHSMPGHGMGQGMMGGGMGGGMMGGMMGGGMMGGQAGDPRAMARMMEMRGDMMKAMGEVMLKHAKKLQEAPPAK
jgi:hypothetical protein